MAHQHSSRAAATGGATPQKVCIRLHHPLGMSQQSRALLCSSNCRRKPSGVLRRKALDSSDGPNTLLKKKNIITDTMSRRQRELLLDNADQFRTNLQSWRLRVHVEVEDEESDDESDFDDDTSSMSDWESQSLDWEQELLTR
eukprot:scaffold10069_cov69-Cylindrotheca_fusiformis.AAC.2